jgi:PEP-CTERM motif
MIYYRFLVALVAVFLSAVSGTAFAALIDITVHDGESLVLKFHQPAVPPAETNVLDFSYGVQSPNSVTGSNISLYDGASFLGIFNGPFQNGAKFATADASPFLSNSAVVDFTSILAGTLQGRLITTPEFSSSSGSLRYLAPSIVTYQIFNLSMTLQTLIIDEAYAAPTASVPEPATAWLLLAGIVGGMGTRIAGRRSLRRG